MPIPGGKLRAPVSRRDLVTRPRLTAELGREAGRMPRFVLISAPAGFGKTTLMAQWLATLDPGSFRSGWLSLDPADSDLRRFLRHVIAAIRILEPEAGADALGMLDADRGPPGETVLVSLVNDLEMVAGHAVLALDDYHLVDDPVVHDAMRFLVDNLPPQVTLAMTTRADPPFALSRLRVRGELAEIRAADLRFTDTEADAFLNDLMGLALDADQVAALEARTEGWAAGLQLAALSARRTTGDDRQRFVEAFTGTHRLVLDYLVEEVLDRQPPGVRDFLLDTSVLDQLTAPLCDAVTGRTDGQRMLDHLDRSNVFLVALDDRRAWWRYHHLFADVLRARLAASAPDRVRRLHADAARWYAAAGLLADAIPHAVSGTVPDVTADLVELAIPGLRRRREDRTLRECLGTIPEDLARDRPLLATANGWARLSEGDIDGVEPWLDAAERALDAPDRGLRALAPLTAELAELVQGRSLEVAQLPSTIAAYRAAAAQARGDVDGTVSHARRALELAGPQDHLPRAAGAGFAGLAAWAAGDLVEAVDTFTEAVDSLHAAGMTADELGATVALGNMWLARGRPIEARRLYERALTTADDHDGPLTTTGDLHVGLADVLREQGELEAAAEHLELARDLGDRGSLLENRHRWHTTTAALLRASGDLDGAVAELDRAELLFLPGYFPDVRPIAAARARVWIAQGRLDRAQEWAQEWAREWARDRGVAATDPVSYLAEFDHLTLARLLIAQDAAHEALPLLDRVLAAAADHRRDGSLIEGHVVRSLAHQAIGDADAAAADLAVALTAGVPAGYCRLFLDEREPILRLLDQVARTASADVRAHADTLLRVAQSPATPSAPGGLTGERLSDREVQVLRLLATELTGPEIARSLFVSVNTLRTHTKHIFTKLDVNTRRAAVRRATESGLL